MGLRLLNNWAPLTASFILGLLPLTLKGQTAEVRFLTGTTYTDPASGSDYAFLRFQSQDPFSLRGLQASLYARQGLPSSASPFVQAPGFSLQTQPAALRALALTFPEDLFDPIAFQDILGELFGEFSSSSDIDTAEMLSTVLQVAEGDDGVYRRLLALSYEEPYIAVCMGLAQLVPMPNPIMTYEVRTAADGTSGIGLPDSVVIGRVILNTSNPATLPQPPMPQQIDDLGPTGHLNVKLRWNLSDSLLRATPSIFGYDIFRIKSDLAESLGYDTNPPTAAQMTDLLADPVLDARRLNTGAVLPVDSDDLTQPFFIDDNEAAFDRGVPLVDGDSYFYFIAARDLLGRHGPLSPGLLVTICARFPPESPRSLSVSNDRDYDTLSGSVDTRLKIQWEAHSSAQEDPPLGYYVYRWSSVSEMQTILDPADMLARRVSGLIPHVPGQPAYTFRDDGPGAPNLPDDAGITQWYSVRTVIDTACGEVESGDSSPAWGVLRDFQGPDNAPTVISLSDTGPTLTFSDLPDGVVTPAADAFFIGPTGNVRRISTRVRTTTLAVNRFRMGVGTEGPNGQFIYTQIAETEFTGVLVEEAFNIRFPGEFFADNATARIWVEALDTGGRTVRRHAALNNFAIEQDEIEVIAFELGIEAGGITLVPGDTLPEGSSHRPANPATGDLNPLELLVEIPLDAREFKAYKRVNRGPLMFFDQGTELDAPGSIVEIQDTAFPPYGGEICYFIQWFDTHGNPSPLGNLGCVTVSNRLPLPVPLLEEPVSGGSADNEAVTLQWFCPPEGVERFRVYVGTGLNPVNNERLVLAGATLGTTTVRQSFGPIGTYPQPSGSSQSAPLPSVLMGDTQFYPTETGRVGSDFGNPFTPGQFELTMNVVPGVDYRFFVVAVGPDGTESAHSNEVNFRWTPPVAEPPALIPWPARSIGAVDYIFIGSVNGQVVDNPPRFQGIAVHIGDYFGDEGAISFGGSYTQDNVQFTDPTTYPDKPSSGIELFSTSNGETILPCVLYRQQVDPDSGEPVTGDLVQVSPLIEDLLLKSDGTSFSMYNPFVDLYPTTGGVGVFIKDTQPVILGKTYQYHAVRLKPNGEIDRVIPIGPITVPLNP